MEPPTSRPCCVARNAAKLRRFSESLDENDERVNDD